MDESALQPWPGRAVLHVDMDAFFASVEQLDHPEWRGRPVIVGSPQPRGVVSTASYEARTFGVRSAMPAFQARRLCPNAIWAQPRFDRYQELSRQVRAIFAEMTPLVETASIDEAYLDATPGRYGPHPVAVAQRIRERIDALGLTCSIGVASGKTVAKVASDARKPHGLTVVRPGEEAAFLAPLGVRALGGIGPSTFERLAAAGVRTLGQLAALDTCSAERLLGSSGPTLVARAAGVDPRPVSPERERKSVSAERTFEHDLADRVQVERELRSLVTRVARRLRAKAEAGRTLTVKLRYADFTTRTASRTLRTAADLEAQLTPVAFELLRDAWTSGVGLRLLGFGVSGLAQPAEQLELFGDESIERTTGQRELSRGIDQVRERFGEDALDFGTKGIRTPRDKPSEGHGKPEGHRKSEGPAEPRSGPR